jgi:hypothetical protein
MRNAHPTHAAVWLSKRCWAPYDRFGVRASVGRMAAKRLEVPAVRSGSRGWRSNGRRPPHTGVLIATFRCDAPARCGAFADEWRIVATAGGAQNTGGEERGPSREDDGAGASRHATYSDEQSSAHRSRGDTQESCCWGPTISRWRAAPGHWPACHLATRNPLRIGPEATRKIAGRPPDAPRPFSSCAPAACRRARTEFFKNKGAARILNLHPNTLRHRMSKLGIKRSAHRQS